MLDTVNWMHKMLKLKNDVTFANLVLPGAHNSGSYVVRPGTWTHDKVESNKLSCGFCSFEAGIHQDVSVYEQLKDGVRFLHMKLMIDPQMNRLRTCSELQNADLEAVLKQIAAFLRFSKDIVVVRIESPNQVTSRRAKELIDASLGSHRIVEFNNATMMLQTRLTDLVNDDRRCVLLNCGDITEQMVQHGETISPSPSKKSPIKVLRFSSRHDGTFASYITRLWRSDDYDVDRMYDLFAKRHKAFLLNDVHAVLFHFAISKHIAERLILASYVKSGIVGGI